MAINPVPVTIQPQKTGTLDTIASGLDIIGKTLGIALEVPKYLQQKRVAEADIKLSEARAEEVGRKKLGELTDLDRVKYTAYSQDYQPSPIQTPKSIVVKIAGEDTFWEPKATETTDRRFKQEQSLRKEFLTESTPFIQQAEGYGRVLSGFKEKNGPGDIAGIYGYIKLLDPNSAVREGEIALAGQAKSIPDWVIGRYNNAVNGEILPPDVREKFKTSAKGLYDTAKKFQDVREERYSIISSENDVNPNRVIGNLGASVISSIEKSVSGIEHLTDEELEAQISKKRNKR